MYKCRYCEKEFEKYQATAGHTSFCKGNPNREKNIENCRKSHIGIKYPVKNRIIIKIKCEKCKNEFKQEIIDSDYGTSCLRRFCSSHCANGHQHSEKWKQNISNGLKNSKVRIKKTNINYIQCVICNKIIVVKKWVNKKTCSVLCYKKLLSNIVTQKILNGDYIPKLKSISCNYNFKGKIIHCDSKVEYSCLDYFENNFNVLDINRCNFFIEFYFENNTKKYIPDFEIILKEGIYIIECKAEIFNKYYKRKWKYYYDSIPYKKKALIKYCKEKNQVPFFYDYTLNKNFYKKLLNKEFFKETQNICADIPSI